MISRQALRQQRDMLLHELDNNWKNPEFNMKRDRYEIHDSLIMEIRRLNEQLAIN